jgi:hypothetical protein
VTFVNTFVAAQQKQRRRKRTLKEDPADKEIEQLLDAVSKRYT